MEIMIRLSHLLIFSMFLYQRGVARNLGTQGETFEVEEPDLIEEIYAKLKELRNLEALQINVRNRVIRNLSLPPRVTTVEHTKTPRIFEFDPTVPITRDLRDHQGRIFVRRGEAFNPLDRVKMTKNLLFIDGDEESHLRWAISKMKDDQVVKIILVQGSPLKLQERFRQPVYFDQQGMLVNKLGIKQVPALVSHREGKRILTITEEMVEEQ
jgi:conjugal transfer pilus assembly protein TraW